MSPASLLCQAIRLIATVMLALGLIILICNRLKSQLHPERTFGAPSKVQGRHVASSSAAYKPFPKLPKSVVDCGKFSSSDLKKAEGAKGLRLSDIRAMMGRSPSFTAIYGCWRATNVTEKTYRSETSEKYEVLTTFYIDLPSVLKMKRSLFTAQGTTETDGSIVGVTAFIHEGQTTHIPRVRVRGQNETETVNFDASDFLAGLQQMNLPEEGKFPANFILWYESNSTSRDEQFVAPLFNTSSYVPSLRMFYTL